MSTSIAPTFPANSVATVPARFGAAAPEHDRPVVGVLRTLAGFVEDAALLLLIVLMIPVSILVIGVPIALFLRVLLEIARRL